MASHDEPRAGFRYEQRRYVPRLGERFDRLGYAMRLLRLLAPHDVSVAVRPSHRELHVAQGRAWGEPAGRRWAELAIPPDATREQIFAAIAELSGRAREPYLLDLLRNAEEPS